MSVDARPLGIMDSGVGGLSVLCEVRRQLPDENVLYFADQGHVPYGPRPLEEIRAFARAITRFFLTYDVKVITVACNAASAASLYHLRETFPGVLFVGMEPAVKPAAENTRSGIIGVITTRATYQGELFASVVDRFADGVEVVTQVCPEFVTMVEAGQLDTPELRAVAAAYLRPLLNAGIDQLVLGCTHFPFLLPLLDELTGPGVAIVDPGPAVARQTGRVIRDMRNAAGSQGRVTYFTSGDAEAFYTLARRLLDEPVERAQCVGVEWVEGEVRVRAG